MIAPCSPNRRPPPSPETLAQRLFYRLRTGAQLPAAVASWNSMVAAAAAARQSPGDATLWANLANQLDVDSYINYIITIGLAGIAIEHRPAQFRGWRHPVTHRWNAIAWDAEDAQFEPQPDLLPAADQTPNITNHSDDLRPHAYLKFHPTYQTAFHTRLLAVLPQSASSAGPAGVLNDTGLFALFDAGAADFRRTLECEIMRWGYFSVESISATILPGAWQQQLLGDGINSSGYRNGALPRARSTFKRLMRESRLLNDIPPPVITVSGNTATITRTGSSGVIYLYVDGFIKDPRDFTFPEFTPGSVAFENRTLSAENHNVAARIFGPDLDGEFTWSALTVYVAP